MLISIAVQVVYTHRTGPLRVIMVAVDRENGNGNVQIWILVIDCWKAVMVSELFGREKLSERHEVSVYLHCSRTHLKPEALPSIGSLSSST